jgi:hypothetical protein
MADGHRSDLRKGTLVNTVRAAFHVHSEWSYDAKLPLAELSSLLRRQGYDAVFMCEHDRGFSPERLRAYAAACEEASAGGALLIPGIEYADPEDRVHIPTWGPVPFIGEDVPTTRLLETVAAHGGVSVLAHPVRRDAWEIVERDWLQLCTGIEIWTRKWDGWAPNPRACRWAADADLVGIAALDLHLARQTFPLAMRLDITDSLSVETCVEAVRGGHCHALIHGLPAAPFTRGALGASARAVETMRRPVWRAGRRARERLSGAR